MNNNITVWQPLYRTALGKLADKKHQCRCEIYLCVQFRNLKVEFVQVFVHKSD